MRHRLRSPSALLFTAILVLAAVLRLSLLERQAVEHFDEGVYSSVLWYDGLTGESWPARELYAPPLLSGCMAALALVPALADIAPFLPAAICGIAMVAVMAWVASAWFGRAAAVFAACVVGFSDYHILFSGMALTDVPCGLFVLSAVGLASWSVDRNRLGGMIPAGLLCGIAWWFKYSGWLPLAITAAGSTLWWLFEGHRQMTLRRLVAMNGLLALVSFAVWSPWLWSLQSSGGYAAVAANHAGYTGTLSDWESRLSHQLANLFLTDGYPAILGLGSGLVLAGSHRWLIAARSTWNNGTEAPATGYPPTSILVRFVFAALTGGLIALVVWTPLLLSCFAAGGLAGMFLWPVLSRLWLQARGTSAATAVPPRRSPLHAGELVAAPALSPALGQCICLAWIGGMMAATPFYAPFPRLMLPLMTGIWLAAAGAVGWWIEANLSVARRAAAETGDAGSAPMRGTAVLMFLLMTGAFLSFRNSSQPARTLIFADRHSIADAARDLEQLCSESAHGVPKAVVEQLPGGSIIRPEHEAEQPTDVPPPVADDLQRLVKPVVVYAFGEPSLLYHLHQRNVAGLPVGHLNLTVTPEQQERAQSFLVIGPNAKRTPGFWEDWLRYEGRFEFVGEVAYFPSAITLLNYFSPKWLREHPEATRQVFEVYRLTTESERTAPALPR